jgi:hypothetical protein
MQVMPKTITDPGFCVKPARDMSPDEIARVGRDYLAAMVNRYGGDVDAALVAYNWGPGNADKWVKKGKDFGSLPKETQNYVTFIQGKLGGTPSQAIPARAKTPATQPQRQPSLKRAQAEDFDEGSTLELSSRPEVPSQGQITRADMERLGPNYQAAFAATALADSREDDDDFDDDETIAERYRERREKQMMEDDYTLEEEEAPRVSPLAGLELSYQSPFQEEQAPVMMANGGEVATGGITPDTIAAFRNVQIPSAREALNALLKIGREGVSNAESVARRSVAGVPGAVGSIESIFRDDKDRRFATGEEIERQRLPQRMTTPTKEAAGFGEIGEFIDPTIALKVAKPTAKAALKALKASGPQIEKTLGKAADPFGTGLAEPMSILRPTGGEFPTVRSINDAPISKFDKTIAELSSRNPGPEYAPVTRFFDTKIRNYFKKEAGSVSDQVREGLISGRIKIPKDSQLEEMFPEALIKAARDGDITAMKLIEKELDKGTNIKGYKQVEKREWGSDQIASDEMRSAILQQMKSNPNIIPDAMLLRLAKKNASTLSPEAAAKAVADIRAKLKANPELFSTVYEEKIMRMMPDQLAEAIPPEFITKYPGLYTELGELFKAREGIMALKGAAPILDVDATPKLLGMTFGKIHELMQQLPEKELDRMDVATMLNKVIQLDKVNNEAANYAKQAEKLIANKRNVPENISTYGTKPFTSVDNQGFSWREIVEPAATKIQAELLGNSIGGYARPGSYGSLGTGRNALAKGEVRLFGLYDKNNQLMTNVEYITDKAEKLQNTIPQFFGNGPKTGNVAPENFVPQVEELINKLNPKNIPPSIKELLRNKGISFSK